MRKAKTDFGIEISVFKAQTGLNLKEIAELAGVKYSTLVETTTGRCTGTELVPKVRRFMATYQPPAEGTV